MLDSPSSRYADRPTKAIQTPASKPFLDAEREPEDAGRGRTASEARNGGNRTWRSHIWAADSRTDADEPLMPSRFERSCAQPVPPRCLRARVRKTVLPGACGGSG